VGRPASPDASPGSAARAPAIVGLAFGVALALIITLLGPLLLFNPAFTSLLQQRHAVATAFGVPQPEVERVTTAILIDLATDGPFDAAFDDGEPLLDARERSHMHDVAGLVRLLGVIVLASSVAAAATAWRLRHETERQGRIMVLAAGSVGALAVMLGIVFAVAFEPAFLLFHQIFFPAGTYLFEPGSNLITLFPEAFWYEAALAAGATIVLAALVIGIIGALRMRSGQGRRATDAQA
jgi:integral membrane protein (TIGR01906 family)